MEQLGKLKTKRNPSGRLVVYRRLVHVKKTKGNCTITVSTIKIETSIPDGDMHLNANNVRMTSTEKDPRSTKSPLKRYGFSSEGRPLSSNIFNKS